MSKKILFVDDERNVLRSMVRAFMDSDYELECVENAGDALQILEDNSVDMIVSDMRMPGMNGYELLRMVRERYPEVIRIILSGYAEKETLVKAVMDGTAKAYMTKPWDNEKLRQEVSSILASYQSTRESGVLKLINAIDRLPVLPAAYRHIISLIEKDTSMNQIAQFIESEPEYAANVLRTVNSAFYGIRTGSVKKAIVYLGLNTVKNIVLSSEAFVLLSEGPVPKEEVELLWQHSSLCNRLLHGLYQAFYKKKIPEQFAAAGLLHDIGHLIILKYFPREFAAIHAYCKDEKKHQMTDIERQIIGAAHTQLGGYLLDWWNLPSDIVDACLHHHGLISDTMRHREIISLIHVADMYSSKEITHGAFERVDPRALRLLKTSKRQLDVLVKGILRDA
ncbi:MAG: HDOD domain-containing protein [Chitinivibrionales bacterium]